MTLLAFIAAACAAELSEVWVYAPDRRLLPTQGLGFAEGTDGDWVRMVADETGLKALQARGLSVLPVPPPPDDALSGYHTPSQMQSALEALAAAYPDHVQLVDLGWSTAGRPLTAAVLSATAHPQGSLRVVGAHHGDELPTGELVLDLAWHLASGYGADDAITALLQTQAVWLIPHANPDGLTTISRTSATGVDLNRNYGWEWTADALGAGPSPFSEPETRAMRTLSQWNPFSAGLSLHAGATNIGWVWNHTTTAAPDAALMAVLAARYAAETTDPGFWITSGADWYITNGDTTDWTYGQLGMLDFTVEVSVDKTPPAADLPMLAEQHIPAMLDFLTTPRRVCGQLRSAETGHGIAGEVTRAGQPLQTDPQGRFCRTVADDDTSPMTARAPGYTTVLLPDTPQTILLTPTDLVEATPAPALLSASGDGLFTLSAQQVTLIRPGEEDVEAQPDGDDWWVDVAALTPGPWSLSIDGRLAPNALFIGEQTTGTTLSGVSLSGDTISLSGHGFGRGSTAFALWGLERALIPLPLVSQTATALTFDLAPLQDRSQQVDLVVISSGHVLTVLDILTSPLFELPASAHAAEPATGETSGCTATPPPSSWVVAVLTLGMIARRQT